MSDEQFEFDPARLIRTMAKNGHNLLIGTQYHAHGDGWCELALPYSEALVTDTASGILASGPIFTLMDMATNLSIWLKTGTFQPQATLDLRIDYLRPAKPGQRLHESPAFIRAPPAKLRVIQPRQGIKQRVRIGTNSQAVMFEIIARIGDNQQFLRR